MAYEVVLEDFQGPLDLLLHLIKEKEMDLETLEVSVITDQYLAYIDQMDAQQSQSVQYGYTPSLSHKPPVSRQFPGNCKIGSR